MVATSAISIAAMTADETIIGFYDIETTTDVVITPYNGETQVTVAEKNIDEDDAMEQVYVDSKKLEVVYDGASQNNYYSIILVDGSGLPSKDSTIYYINQETANSSSVAVNVSPKLPAETTDMTLYMSSDVASFKLVSIPMSYAVNATGVVPEPAYKLGDANGDDKVDVKDVIAIRRSITGGYSVTINEAASNVNGDTKIDVKDVIAIRRHITGGYSVTINEAASNVNGDDKIDVKDAIVIRRYIAGGYGVELQ